MADIAAGDVTYSITTRRNLANSRKHNRVTISFGDGALTVPSAGIPITIAKCGCPNNIESMVVVDQGNSGYEFKYDQSAAVLFVKQAPAQSHTHHLHFKDNVANTGSGALASENVVTIAANKAGAHTGADIIVSGGGLSGGVSSATLAAAALALGSGLAIAAQVIEVEVIGW